jgi:hypothetical protein
MGNGYNFVREMRIVLFGMQLIAAMVALLQRCCHWR